jgi:hypothetical protein
MGVVGVKMGLHLAPLHHTETVKIGIAQIIMRLVLQFGLGDMSQVVAAVLY